MPLDSPFFFYLTTVGYFLAFMCYLLNAIAGKSVTAAETAGAHALEIALPRENHWGRWATRFLEGSLVLSTLGIVLRTIALSKISGWLMPLPITNTYETLAFFSWAIPLAYWGFERHYRMKALGIFSTGIAFVLITIASSPLVPQEVTPLVPALQSYWLVAHVLFTLAGEALFSVGFAAGAIVLWRAWQGASWPRLKRLDEISYRAVALGFPLFTVGGLVFGAIWAQKAWGRYWSWDPKETWMLISWLIYALYLHVRVRWDWKGQQAAWLIVAGYLATIFTWFGVNYVLSGLHSYN